MNGLQEQLEALDVFVSLRESSVEQAAKSVAMEALLRALIETHPNAKLLLASFKRMLAGGHDTLRNTGFEGRLPPQSAKAMSERVDPYSESFQASIEARANTQE